MIAAIVRYLAMNDIVFTIRVCVFFVGVRGVGARVPVKPQLYCLVTAILAAGKGDRTLLNRLYQPQR